MNYRQYYTVFVIATFFAAIPIGNSYAQENPQEFTKIEGNDLQNNSLADMILKNIEIANQKIQEAQEAERKRIEQQKFIEEQRRIAQADLEKDLAAINKKYEDFTPRNAFAKFVSGFNATHHGIYWDQFDYLNAKVQQANKAKNDVLSNGGSYADAMKQYVKHAAMSRTEMIKTVSNLNIKHGFSDNELQSHFDENGKLPRYDNDDYTPKCFGCEKYEKIKQQILEESNSVPSEKINVSQTSEKTDVSKINHEMEIQKLQNKLEKLKKEFFDEDDLKKQKQIINSMNQIVDKLQTLQDKTL